MTRERVLTLGKWELRNDPACTITLLERRSDFKDEERLITVGPSCRTPSISKWSRFELDTARNLLFIYSSSGEGLVELKLMAEKDEETGAPVLLARSEILDLTLEKMDLGVE